MFSAEDIASLVDPKELQDAAYEHNWDDGYEIPTAIACHPACDLAVALTLFWLSEGVSLLANEVKPNEYNIAWVKFCRFITERILNNEYNVSSVKFIAPIGPTQLYKLKKLGIPDILFLSIGVENA